MADVTSTTLLNKITSAPEQQAEPGCCTPEALGKPAYMELRLLWSA